MNGAYMDIGAKPGVLRSTEKKDKKRNVSGAVDVSSNNEWLSRSAA